MALVALTAGLTTPLDAAADPPPWVAEVHLHHATCVHQAIGTAARGLRIDGDRAAVDLQLSASTCAATIERLLAYGVREIQIDGVSHDLLDVLCPTSTARSSIALSRFLLAEQWLWDTLEAIIAADARGSIDPAATTASSRCMDLVADLAARGRAIVHDRFTAQDWRFTHGSWSGTLEELGQLQCPRIAVAAARILARRATFARLRNSRASLFLSSPDGWFVARSRAPTLDARILVPARVWFQVSNATDDDLVDATCPVTATAVTRYTRHRFSPSGAILSSRTTTHCAPFDPAALH